MTGISSGRFWNWPLLSTSVGYDDVSVQQRGATKVSSYNRAIIGTAEFERLAYQTNEHVSIDRSARFPVSVK